MVEGPNGPEFVIEYAEGVEIAPGTLANIVINEGANFTTEGGEAYSTSGTVASLDDEFLTS